MTGFFTAEATEDCLSMVRGIIHLTEYCSPNEAGGVRKVVSLTTGKRGDGLAEV